MLPFYCYRFPSKDPLLWHPKQCSQDRNQCWSPSPTRWWWSRPPGTWQLVRMKQQVLGGVDWEVHNVCPSEWKSFKNTASIFKTLVWNCETNLFSSMAHDSHPDPISPQLHGTVTKSKTVAWVEKTLAVLDGQDGNRQVGLFKVLCCAVILIRPSRKETMHSILLGNVPPLLR